MTPPQIRIESLSPQEQKLLIEAERVAVQYREVLRLMA
jgi:hypothetical protein